MESSIQLANRLREVILNGKWIANTNFQDQVARLDLRDATKKIESLNTIAALTFHVNYYIEGINKVFEGGPLEISDANSFDMPDLNSQKDWEKLKNALWRNAELFASHVENLKDADLKSDFVHEKYGSYRRNIEGVIEHSYYHLGQVSLVKKMVIELKQSED